MTCIVGLIHDDSIYMGADSLVTYGYAGRSLSLDSRKIFKKDDFLIGVSGRMRAAQLIRYRFEPPKRYPDKETLEYLSIEFMDALRKALKGGGHAQKEDEEERFTGYFLIGYQGRLFTIYGDYSVSSHKELYEAIGCGEEFALGSLYSSQMMSITDPEARIRAALSAAEKFSTGVQGPFQIEVLSNAD